MDFAGKKTKKKKGSLWLNKIWQGLFLVGFLILLAGGLLWWYLTRGEFGRFNLVVIDESLTLLSLDQEKNTLLLIKMPANLYLPVTYGKGQIRAGALWQFDLIQKQKGELLKTTLREFLGVPIDDWVKVSLSSQEPVWKKLPFLPLRFGRLRFQIGKVREDKIEIIDLSQTDLVKKANLVDGSEIWLADSLALDGFLKEKFYERKILEENLTITVLNATEKPGLATKAGRIIEQIGGRVVRLGEYSAKTTNCLLFFKKELSQSYTVERLRKLFNCEISHQEVEESRADVTLIVGTDYANQVW